MSLTPAKLIPMLSRRVFARWHANEKALDNDQLLGAVQEHASYIVNGEDPSRDLAEEVSKAAIMRPGGSAEARVDAKVSTLENHLL